MYESSKEDVFLKLPFSCKIGMHTKKKWRGWEESKVGRTMLGEGMLTEEVNRNFSYCSIV